MKLRTVVGTGNSVHVMLDRNGGARWWCSRCGAASVGRMLPPEGPHIGHPAEDEAHRLAEAHVRKHHRSQEGEE